MTLPSLLRRLTPRHVRNKGISYIPYFAQVMPNAVKLALRGIYQNNSTAAFHIISQLAPTLGISGFVTEGAYGKIQSSTSDFTIFRTYARTGTWAQRTNDLLCTFFNTSAHGTYLDIGANIGLTTIPVAQNHCVRCTAFEPDPTNFANLMVNVAVNCTFGNVELKQVAVFDRSSEMELELDQFNLGDHRIRLSSAPGQYHEQERAVIRVRAEPLDSLIKSILKPLALKIDTQGAEPFVFAGGQRTIANADLIILEWWPYGIDRLRGNPKIITEMLISRFESLHIASAEERDLGAPLPVREGCERLMQLVDIKRDVKGFYVEVIARRSSD